MAEIVPGISPITALIATGNYAGDNTNNRAIPHGLGKTPKFVRITQLQGAITWILKDDTIEYIDPNVSVANTVTPKDANNFYVGAGPGFNVTANALGTTYYWVAVG